MLGRSIAALTVVLMSLLVVQAPIATVDRVLHATGQGHGLNAFATALVDTSDHDVRHDQAETPRAKIQGAEAGAPADPAAPGPHHHHHHDGPSVYGLAGAPSLPPAGPSAPTTFGLKNDLRHGVGGSLQERPPKTVLAHVA